MESPSSSCPQVTFSTPSTSTKHRSRQLFSGLKGMLRRNRRNDKTFDNSDEFPPPLPVDAASTIKRARRQTYVMHSAPSLEVPRPTPVLTLSSHHLVVRESDRRDLAGRAPYYLSPIPEDSQPGGGDDSNSAYTSSSSIASSSSSSSLHTLDYPDHLLDSPNSHWSDDSASDEFDYSTQPCQCNDLTFTKSTRICTVCTGQDVPEDEGLIDSDVDSLLDSYLDEQESYNRQRAFSAVSSSTSSSFSTHYDPLFSPRSSSTTFTVASPGLKSSRPETPVDIRDFDMILTSSPPSPHGVRFNRASIDARDALIAESRRKRISTGTI